MSDHDHTHGHDHLHGVGQAHGARARSFRRLVLVLGLVLVYMVAEVVGGLLTNSLALLADAGHMLSDAAALGLSLFAMWIARRPPTPQKTYGYYRAEILAALANGATLVAISIYIFIEAYQRFLAPPEVLGSAMMGVAVGGLIVNVGALVILHRSRDESLNMRGARLHVLGDAAGSVGAIVAGLLIWAFSWYWADPLASALIGVLIMYSSWNLLKSAVSVLMENAPGHIDVDEVRNAIMRLDGVIGVHDLHVWTITSGLESLSAHVTIEGGPPAADLLHTIRMILREQFGIDHITIQIEPESFVEQRPRV
jgi:cobalt-zinc-cadmium efflux system protein